MCSSKADGGKRCEYADMIANVRRKARYKHRDSWEVERKADEAVSAWKAANPEIVREHLPSRMPFQYTPKNQNPVSQELLDHLTPSSRTPVTGATSTEEYRAKLKAMYDSHQEWLQRLTEEEMNSVTQYAMTSYITMNALLRKKGFVQAVRKDYGKNADIEEKRQRAEHHIQQLKSALKKSVHPEEPQKLYRFFRVPPGVTPKEYVERYMKTGEGFSDPAFMSTSSDPEYVMAHVFDRNKSKTNKNYIVMEILTKRGQSMQQYEKANGRIQALENEVLLPAGTKLRVVGFNKSQRFEYGSDRRDLFNRLGNFGSSEYAFSSYGHHSQGDRLNIPMVQLIDEKLITEYDKKEKEKRRHLLN